MNKVENVISEYYLELQKLQLSYIEKIVILGLSHTEIGTHLNISRYKSYRLYRWGLNRLSKTEKREIRKRDKNKCRKCGTKDLLEVHHIKGGRNNNPKNLLTLCIKCHRKADSKTAKKGWANRRKKK